MSPVLLSLIGRWPFTPGFRSAILSFSVVIAVASGCQAPNSSRYRNSVAHQAQPSPESEKRDRNQTYALTNTIVIDQIRTEATLPRESAQGNPLPLAGHWCEDPKNKSGIPLSRQLALINAGHHLVPWLTLWSPDEQLNPSWPGIYRPLVEELAKAKLPLTLLSDQWEDLLTNDPAFSRLPSTKNPDVIATDGHIIRELSPFGAVEPWREAGRKWASSKEMHLLQTWYPDPPLVLMISNNEPRRLVWPEVEQDARYLKRYRGHGDDAFKRKVVAEGYIERERALHDGIRSALISPAWRANVKFVAFNATGPSEFGKAPDWLEKSLEVPGRIDPAPLEWDGAEFEYYYYEITDCTLSSLQVEAMNWVFMENQTYELDPDFWTELVTWDGSSQSTPLRQICGRPMTPDRFVADVQFGMWLLRPRTVREWRYVDDSVARWRPAFTQIVGAVDRFYSNSVLEDFWKHGRLVANPASRHPYQSAIPSEYRNVSRWFLLDTSANEQKLRSLDDEVRIFALAVVTGSAPHRRWLVYAFSPLGDHDGITIAVPGFGSIQADVDEGGRYYVLDEGSHAVSQLSSVAAGTRLP